MISSMWHVSGRTVNGNYCSPGLKRGGKNSQQGEDQFRSSATKQLSGSYQHAESRKQEKACVESWPESGEVGGRVWAGGEALHMYTCGWFILMYGKNHHATVIILY